MNSYIDREQLLRDLDQWRATHTDERDRDNEYYDGVSFGLMTAMQLVMIADDTGARPERTSYWAPNKDPKRFVCDQYRCHACGSSTMQQTQYCGGCGARMTSKEENYNENTDR